MPGNTTGGAHEDISSDLAARDRDRRFPLLAQSGHLKLERVSHENG